MQTIQTEVEISNDRRLVIDLPENLPTGTYQVVLVLTPKPPPSSAIHHLNEAAGQIKTFSQRDPVQWQQQIRNEWDEPKIGLSSPH